MKICGEVVLEYLNLDKILRCSGVVAPKNFSQCRTHGIGSASGISGKHQNLSIVSCESIN